MDTTKLKILILSQSSVFFASSLIFPFYILFIKNVGTSFSQFGLSYGLFGVSAALIHPLLGRLYKKVDQGLFLVIHSFGMAGLLLLFPHITSILQVYGIQLLLGILGALQKHGEKVLVADFTDGTNRGAKVGNYHFWTSIFSAMAIIAGGFLADYFTIHIIFYISSVIYFVSGCIILRKLDLQLRKFTKAYSNQSGAR